MSPVPSTLVVSTDLVTPQVDVTAVPTAMLGVTVAPSEAKVVAGAAVGPAGPPGPPGPWTQMTQAEYNALPIKDPFTLYVIIG